MKASVSSKPTVLKRGFAQVKIYACDRTIKGRTYAQFILSYNDGHRRIRRAFSDHADARRSADEVLAQLVKGDHAAIELNGSDRTTYLAAKGIADRIGKPLNVILEEYAHACKALPSDISLSQAVEGYAAQRGQIRVRKTVEEVVAELLDAKENAQRSHVHVKDLRSRLGAFARDFKVPMEALQASLIQKWLDNLPMSNRTKYNYCRHITGLVRFAVRRKYASSQLVTDLEAIELPEIPPTETEVYTPAELREMLDATREELIPWLAIAAFCGLRSAEILRLEWKDVHLDEKFVEIRAANAKTGARRSVPLCDAALSWLQPLAGREGRVAHYWNENKFCAAVIADVHSVRRQSGNREKFQWKRNALRHSFCSYRLALLKDAPRVALEAGNSPAMIFRHYHRLSKDAEATAWFNTSRDAAEHTISPAVLQELAVDAGRSSPLRASP